MKVIVAGSRSFNDYQLMENKLGKILKNQEEVIIVSGTARGADKLGERYADNNGYDVIEMPADWDKYGKSAGYKRNEHMAQISDAAVIFWDGESKGTKHMIDLSEKHGLLTRVIRF